MTDIAISVKNLSKKYRLYDSPQHRLREALHPFRKKYHRDFWALKDVSFDVKRGETVGIIGRNGSGKSTLLQIIVGTLTSTKGSVDINGRISALLELGSGFNPEFTGIDNIYFNGSIKGFSKEEMDAKLNDILAFADIGDFVYQPVKTYSSGMQVRLAFSVAVNIDPEILIVDEALAVGDMKFGQKCLRKMDDFREQQKTILFVSHDMAAIKNLCNKAIWINDGQILQTGDPKTITKNYANYMSYGMLPTEAKNKITQEIKAEGVAEINPAKNFDSQLEWDDVSGCSSIGERGAEIKRVTLYNKNPLGKTSLLEGGERLVFMADLEIKEDILLPIVSADIKNELGNLIFGINNYFLERNTPPLKKGGKLIIEFEFKLPLLKNGKYSISTAIADGTPSNHVQHHIVHDAYVFQMASRELSARHYYVTLDEAKINFQTKP